MKSMITPYLHFNGKTAEAMRFYQSILGGDLTMQTYGELNMGKTPEEKALIMHALLRSDSLSFMASDGNSEHPVTFGDNIKLSLAGTDEALLTQYFNGLAAGGSVMLPLSKQFWGDTFGEVADKFGVHWMVDIGVDK